MKKAGRYSSLVAVKMSLINIIYVDKFMSISAIDSTDSMSAGSAASDSDNPSTFELEVLDYIPLVSLVSGVARTIFGAMQLVVAAVQSTVDLVDFLFHPYDERSGKNDGSYMYNQGRANMARGSVAMVPILGNIALYLYDHSRYAKSGDRIDWTIIPL